MINLKFIGRTYLKIKKFFTPAKWETIWTSKCSGFYTLGSIPYKKGSFTAIVKFDRYKNKVQSYMTDGVNSVDVELAYLVAQSNTLGDILKRYKITF